MGSERACCPVAPEAVDVEDESEPLNDRRLLQDNLPPMQSHFEPASVSNDQIKFKKEIDGDKGNTPSPFPNQQQPDPSPPAPAETAKPALGPRDTLIEMDDPGPSEEQIQPTDQTQVPAASQPVLLGAGVSDAVNNRIEPLVGNVMPQIPNVQLAPIPTHMSESVNLNGEMSLPALPLPKTDDPIVNSTPSIPEAPATNGVITILKEPELNGSKPSNTFIGSRTDTMVQKSGPTNPMDAPILTAATPKIPFASDPKIASANAPNELQPTSDVKSEAAVGLSNVQNNTGRDYWWVPVLVAGVVASLG